MKTIIISDLHNRVDQADTIIQAEKPDQIVFLGDFLDNFHDTPDDARKTAIWLKNSLQQTNRIHLFGNHELGYCFGSHVGCSGYTWNKHMVINDVLTRQDWNKLQTFCVLDHKWLLTHAGVHPFHMLPYASVIGKARMSLADAANKLLNDTPSFLQAAHQDTDHWFLSAGYCRSGSSRFGGLFWCDFDREFIPINGINQIVGHTPNMRPRWITSHNNQPARLITEDIVGQPEYGPDVSYNLCLDTNTNHYAVWNGSELVVKYAGDL
jgi:predicted phosphodiesterase